MRMLVSVRTSPGLALTGLEFLFDVLQSSRKQVLGIIERMDQEQETPLVLDIVNTILWFLAPVHTYVMEREKLPPAETKEGEDPENLPYFDFLSRSHRQWISVLELFLRDSPYHASFITREHCVLLLQAAACLPFTSEDLSVWKISCDILLALGCVFEMGSPEVANSVLEDPSFAGKFCRLASNVTFVLARDDVKMHKILGLYQNMLFKYSAKLRKNEYDDSEGSENSQDGNADDRLEGEELPPKQILSLPEDKYLLESSKIPNRLVLAPEEVETREPLHLRVYYQQLAEQDKEKEGSLLSSSGLAGPEAHVDFIRTQHEFLDFQEMKVKMEEQERKIRKLQEEEKQLREEVNKYREELNRTQQKYERMARDQISAQRQNEIQQRLAADVEKKEDGDSSQKEDKKEGEGGDGSTAFELINEIRKEREGLETMRKALCGALDRLGEALYSQTFHFVHEIIQNFDDCKFPEGVEPSMHVKLLSDSFLFWCNEQGFREQDIRSICSLAESSKQNIEGDTATGEKGLGFKAVFAATTNPHVISGPYQFCFDSLAGKDSMSYITPLWLGNEKIPEAVKDFKNFKNGAGTILYLPLKENLRGTDFADEVQKSIGTLVLLNLRKLRHITVESPSGDRKRVQRDRGGGIFLQIRASGVIPRISGKNFKYRARDGRNGPGPNNHSNQKSRIGIFFLSIFKIRVQYFY
jgi:hypothetical protein